MTTEALLAWAQGYYGPVPKGMRLDMFEYLSAMTDQERAILKDAMRRECPSHLGQVNGYPPSIADMEKLMPEVKREAAAVGRHERERVLEAKLLPAPEVETYSDLVNVDWMAIFRQKVGKHA